MRNGCIGRLFLVSLLFLISVPQSVFAESPQYRQTVILNGHTLTIDEVVRVARYKAEVVIALGAMQRVQDGHDLYLAAMDKGIVGAGISKKAGITIVTEDIDSAARKVDLQGELDERYLNAFETSLGVSFNKEVIRAAMVVRLNTILNGATGCSQGLANKYLEFLNKGIYPVSGDVAPISKQETSSPVIVANSMMGKGFVYYKDKKLVASTGLTNAGVKPIRLEPADLSAVLNTSSFAVGYAALVAFDANEVIENSEIIYSLMLEGANANISMLNTWLTSSLPLRGFSKSSVRIADNLSGSYLWDNDPGRTYKDPASFIAAVQVFGLARDSLDYLYQTLAVRLNGLDANPVVQVDTTNDQRLQSLNSQFGVSSGNLFGKVSPMPYVDAFYWDYSLKSFVFALNKLAHISYLRCIDATKNGFTGLPSTLMLDKTSMLFRSLIRSLATLDTEIDEKGQTLYRGNLSMGRGDMDEINVSVNDTPKNIGKIIEKIYYIMSVEAMIAAQLIDLRLSNSSGTLRLGKGTMAAYKALRNVMPFVNKDRSITPDIGKVYQLIRTGNLNKALMKD